MDSISDHDRHRRWSRSSLGYFYRYGSWPNFRNYHQLFLRFFCL